MKKNKRCATETSYVAKSTYGVWGFSLSGDKIVRIVLPTSPPRGRRMLKWLGVPRRDGSARSNDEIPPALDRIMSKIARYFSGVGKDLTVPIVFQTDSRFNRRVWERMRRIPFGKTMTYGDLANYVGSPAACRAVGNACAANPLPLIIPCHRVVGKGGLGGFSAGLKWKRFLLVLEKPPKAFLSTDYTDVNYSL